MPKLIASLLTSLDGYFETTDRSIAWANLSDDFDDHSVSQLNDIGMLLFGRVTYEGMVSFWTTPEAAEGYPEVHRMMNARPKAVFSSTLESVDWAGTTLVSGDPVAAVAELKQRDDIPGVLAVYGSSSLAATLVDAGLVDELQLVVSPTLLGDGHTVLGGLAGRVDLRLLRATTFGSGNLLLCYRPLTG